MRRLERTVVPGKRTCEHCQATRCNKFFKIPIGPASKRVVLCVCGKCVLTNASALREWLDKKEAELK